jgi:hypothetical protein
MWNYANHPVNVWWVTRWRHEPQRTFLLRVFGEHFLDIVTQKIKDLADSGRHPATVDEFVAVLGRHSGGFYRWGLGKSQPNSVLIFLSAATLLDCTITELFPAKKDWAELATRRLLISKFTPEDTGCFVEYSFQLISSREIGRLDQANSPEAYERVKRHIENTLSMNDEEKPQ